MPVKLQSDTIIITYNLTASRFVGKTWYRIVNRAHADSCHHWRTRMTLWHGNTFCLVGLLWGKYTGPCLNIKTVFSSMGIPMLKMRRPQDRLIFSMGIPLLVRRHPYTETASRWIPSQTASDADFGCILWGQPEQTVDQTVDLPVRWYVTTRTLCQCNKIEEILLTIIWKVNTCMATSGLEQNISDIIPRNQINDAVSLI